MSTPERGSGAPGAKAGDPAPDPHQPVKPGGTVRGAVAKAEEQKSSIAYNRVRAAEDWFSAVVPSHIDPKQYIAVLLGVLQRNDKLLSAAEENPGSLMIAAAECARLGLVPGDTYHFVPFWNKERHIHEITGIVSYQGEIELIYRAGAVESVHAEVVRERDSFVWKPGMVIPDHQIPTNKQGQIGLVSEDERGILTGVYAYARLRGGGVSRVVVMSVSEVMKHRAIAKTKEFWGPEWPDEGPWTPQMWLKTAVHGLPTWVPSSPEYMSELWRAAAAVSSAPLPVDAPREMRSLMPPELPPPPAPTVRGAVEAARGGAKTAARRQPQQPAEPEKESQADEHRE